MSVMFFKVLFMIGLGLGVFLFTSWFFSCLYTEWQLDAEERRRRKEEEELKDQDPDGADQPEYMEETVLTIDTVDQNIQGSAGKLKNGQPGMYKQNPELGMTMYNMGTMPKEDKKKNKQSQAQQQAQVPQQPQAQQQALFGQQQFSQTQQLNPHQQYMLHQQILHQQMANQQQLNSQQLVQYAQSSQFVDHQLQQHYMMLAAQQQEQELQQQELKNQQLKELKNQQLQEQQALAQAQAAQVQAAQVQAAQVQAAQTSILQQQLQAPVVSQQSAQAIPQQVVDKVEEIPVTVYANNASQNSPNVPSNVEPEKTEQQASASPTQLLPSQPVPTSSEKAAVANPGKPPYRIRKQEEYGFMRALFELVDLRYVKPNACRLEQYEKAIDYADARQNSKIKWSQAPILNSQDHMTAAEECVVLLGDFFDSSFYSRLPRKERLLIIEQLAMYLNPLLSYQENKSSRNLEHKEDLIWIWTEIQDTLGKEKNRVDQSGDIKKKSSKPSLPAKPSQPLK